MDIQTPENEGVIRYLTRHGPRELLVSPAAASRDPYLKLGSHPDIVERVWDELGTALERKTRMIVCGIPALVHPATGEVFALAFGTQYVIKLARDQIEKALERDFRSTNRWNDGTSTDLEVELGPGWVFGQWSRLEAEWLEEAYAPFRARAGRGR